MQSSLSPALAVLYSSWVGPGADSTDVDALPHAVTTVGDSSVSVKRKPALRKQVAEEAGEASMPGLRLSE